MNLFIPEIATKITLAEPWTFKLIPEDRNDTFISTVMESHAFDLRHVKKSQRRDYWYEYEPFDLTLPVGFSLSVARIYVRVGQKEYSSVSFTVAKGLVYSEKQQKTVSIKGRFWAKLEDVNKMIIEDPRCNIPSVLHCPVNIPANTPVGPDIIESPEEKIKRLEAELERIKDGIKRKERTMIIDGNDMIDWGWL